MAHKNRSYTRELKMKIVEGAESGVSVAELSRIHDVSSGMIYKWIDEHGRLGQAAFVGSGKHRGKNTPEAKIAQMERLIGRQALEIEFLKNVHRRLSETEE